MPRKKIKIAQQLDYLSILDESGALDAKLEPDIPEDILLKLYRTMVLARIRESVRPVSLRPRGASSRPSQE